LGMRQRLGLAGALLGDPELLVLDEPANGLDPEGVRWLRDFLRSFAGSGHTVLVSSHVLAEVAQTVDHVLIISRGKLVRESRLDELTAGMGGAVRVRSPEAGKLREALERALRTGHDQRARRRDRGRVGHRAARAARGAVLARGGLPRADVGEAGVIAQIRAEIIKVRSTRTTLGLVLGMIAIILLFVILTALLTSVGEMSGREQQRNLFA